MLRREFVKGVGAGVILPNFVHGFDLKLDTAPETALAAVGNTDHILVVIQLEGGNDGLNTLLPVDENYNKLVQLRPNIIGQTSGQQKNGYLQLKNRNDVRLHPALTGVKNLYDNGLVQFINGVSVGGHSSSHPTATRLILNASTKDLTGNYGWLGELLEAKFPDYTDFSKFPSNLPDFPASIEFGNYSSLLLQSSSGPMNVLLNDATHFCKLYWQTQVDAQGNCTYTGTNSCDINEAIPNHPDATIAQNKIQYLRSFGKVTEKYACVLRKAYDNAKKNSVGSEKFLEAICGYAYNENDAKNQLDIQLKTIAYWINGGLPTQVYQVRQDGYDTHGGQASNQHYLLQNLNFGIGKFMEALAPEKRDKVICIVVTEFARTIKENGSYGTDHGTANMMFAFGYNVNGGVLGSNPTIPDPSEFLNPRNFDNANNIVPQYDFRSVYQTLLKNWFCVDQSTIRNILGGKKEDDRGNVLEDWDTLPIIKQSPCCTQLPDPVISGNQQVCPDGSYAYSTQAVSGAQYVWDVDGGVILSGQGTANVQVKWNKGVQGKLNVKVTK
ncbi:MAG TPA: DUF1501 domain-containing protein [Saprospiraceae bacterium]|nr:DUF1501 domain-containing protein [Saprospiraceae bacterium]